MKVGTSFVILGQTDENTAPIDFNAAVAMLYTDAIGDNTFGTIARAQKTSIGIVNLSGLARMTGTPAALSTLATLPVGYRPDNDILMPAIANTSAVVLKIKATGEIQNYTAFPTNAYVNLDGISFPAAGVATWIDIGTSGSAFGSSFETLSTWTTTYGAAGFWKDPYGCVWFRGVVRPKVAVSADNTVICTLPAGYVADLPQHVRGCGEAAFANFQFAPTGLLWKTNSPGGIGDWISLGGVIGVTATGRSINPWIEPPLTLNSWVNYGGAYPGVQYVRREDGLCMTNGLMKTGTPISAMISMTQEEMWPTRGRLLMTSVSALLMARMDIGSVRESIDGGHYEPGSIIANSGSATWFSLDGRSWIP